MPIDPTSGQWVEPTYSTPGVGAIGAMRTMNEFTSQNNYQKNEDLQALKMLQELQNPGTAGLVDTPTAQDLLGRMNISPDAATTAINASPAIQFSKGMGDLTADNASPSSEQIMGLAGRTGAVPASGLLSPWLKFSGAQSRASTVMDEKVAQDFTKNAAIAGTPQQAADMTIAANPGWDPAKAAAMRTAAAQMSPDMFAKYKSQVGLNESRASELDAKTQETLTLLQPKKTALEQAAALSTARANLDQAETAVMSGAKLDAKTAQGYMAQREAAMRLLQPKPSPLGGLLPVDPVVKARAQEMINTIDRILTSQGIPIAPAGKTPAPGAPAPAPAANPLGLSLPGGQ